MRWRRNKLVTGSGDILCGMGSDVACMRYRHIPGEWERWSSDEGKLGAKTGVRDPYLIVGFGDCDDGRFMLVWGS